ncbi:DUF421 domain-containing protein [Streptomyces sp. URMC 125]|uniref:DUF421 domain-containing protein n=1 Tax=Streptomyces sp. URMC 125 TaxID=3423419 RepID=UPI003F1C3CDF
MFFDSWYDLLRVAVMATCAYAAAIAVVRLSGKRTLAQMNAFDLVVTVALGSTLATILLTSTVSLAEGALALTLLAALQFTGAWLAVRSGRFRRLVKAEPTLLLSDGRLLTEAMARQRVTAGEVRQAIRSQGVGAVEDVAAVVLETDGKFSVIPRSQAGSGSSLQDRPGTGRGRPQPSVRAPPPPGGGAPAAVPRPDPDPDPGAGGPTAGGAVGPPAVPGAVRPPPALGTVRRPRVPPEGTEGATEGPRIAVAADRRRTGSRSAGVVRVPDAAARTVWCPLPGFTLRRRWRGGGSRRVWIPVSRAGAGRRRG